jgi:hypothetical protein
MLNNVQTALAAIKAEGTFATVLICGSADLKIEVKGVGPIRFPVSAAMAAKLCAAARPAPFGRRDKTLHDSSVRDTWQLGRTQVKIDTPRWKHTLDAQLPTIKRCLGLPEDGRLDAVFDKMLVYGPGQFFSPHQDSERADDMVGSLVVTLPSAYTGGDTIVEHQAEQKIFSGPKRGNKELSLLAFYADCRHEVRPIKSGYRIALTYQLHYRGATRQKVPVGLSALLERLSTSVKAYFSTPDEPLDRSSTAEPPDRLIYLLDHEYTQKSLAWNRLKNGDRLRAAALLHVADRLACEVYLALADVHETWSCEGDDWDGGYGGRPGRRSWREGWSDDDEDDEEGQEGQRADAAPEDYELEELLDSDMELRSWVDKDGKSAPGLAGAFSEGEVCCTKPSAELHPFKSEHEGYMGNYGNTVDRWYHRAAVVMWPKDRDFAVRAKLSPAWAISELAALLKQGATSAARDKASSLLPFWKGTGPEERSAVFFLKLLKVAASLDDSTLAHDLLAPFGAHRLGIGSLTAFTSLVTRYGLSWSKQVFTTWSEHQRYTMAPLIEPKLLPRLCEQLLAAPVAHGRALAIWLLEQEVASFEQRHRAALHVPHAGLAPDNAAHRHDELLALLDGATTVSAGVIREGLVAFLTTPATALPLMSAGELLMECRKKRTPAAVRALGLHRLYHHVVGLLEQTLAAPERSPDDWSIDVPLQCKCELCAALSAFLRDRQRREYPWPLAKDRRQHIHHMLDSYDVPVTHVTTRRGSPYTLVLTKQKALFERAGALRKRQKALLSWLKKERSSFLAFSEPSPALPTE